MITKKDNLTTTELEAILTIWLTANSEAHPFIPESYWQDNLELVKEQIPKSDLYVYSENNQIIAFLGMNETYIAGIFVKNGYRNQGIGQALLREAKRLNHTLLLSVYAKNQNALNFYQKQGFQQVSEQIDQTGELEYELVWKK